MAGDNYGNGNTDEVRQRNETRGNHVEPETMMILELEKKKKKKGLPFCANRK